MRICSVVGPVLLGALLAAPAVARAQPLRDRDLPDNVAEIYRNFPVIELVTMGVGQRIWERHGHIALCVSYAERSRNRCYNYGTGDFAHPATMGWGFFRGENSFWVARVTPAQLLATYTRADRTVWVQPLPLTDEQEQAIIQHLERDILEENKYYSYDHFWDNCTTRVRDVIDEATDGALSKMNEPVGDATFRDLARQGFYGMRIPLLITDIAMGRTTDREPSYYERLFLPDYMREAATKRWGIEPLVVYQRKGAPPLDDGPSGRVLFALVILLLTAPAWATRLWRRFERVGLAIALLGPVLLGFAFWTLAIISPLSYVRYNESCLIFLPLDLLLLLLPVGARKLYARGRVIMLCAVGLLLLIGVLHQPLLAPLLWPLIPAAAVAWRPQGRARQ